MRTAKLNLAAVVLAAGALGLAGVGTALAWPRTGPPAVPVPQPELTAPVVAAAPEPPADGDWLPRKLTDPVPTAFPDLKLPDRTKIRPGDYDEELAKLCPRFFGKEPITIDPTDDTYRRLLKAQLHQAALGVRALRQQLEVGAWTPERWARLFRCCEDMRATATELWANDPKKLRPWLEEFVILAKEWERVARLRLNTGVEEPSVLSEAQHRRLDAEAALWKFTHPAGK